MSNDNGLVDEYEKLQKQKKEIEVKEGEIRKQIIDLAKQKNTEILFGMHKKCSIKSYDKIIYPEDKSIIEKALKDKGLLEEFSSINYFKLSPRILKGQINPEISALTKKEKAFRLSLIDKGGL